MAHHPVLDMRLQQCLCVIESHENRLRQLKSDNSIAGTTLLAGKIAVYEKLLQVEYAYITKIAGCNQYWIVNNSLVKVNN